MRKLVKTCEGEIFESPPMWIMRQAGRYLPEYRKIRQSVDSFLDLCYSPELATEVTLQPLRRFDLDAAILFSDILVIPDALGQKVEFKPNIGPCLDTEGLKEISFVEDHFHAHLAPVYETVARLRDELDPNISLIGFSGAPWTLLCYMIEGQGSKTFEKTKIFLGQNPEKFQFYLNLVTLAVSEYLKEQIRQGADVVKIFDSWAGMLDNDDFVTLSFDPISKIINDIRDEFPDFPIIVFTKGVGVNILKWKKMKNIVIALDYTYPVSWCDENFEKNQALQGNLDPFSLFKDEETLCEKAIHIKDTFSTRPFIFNFGHGIHKMTNPEQVEKIIRAIKG